MVRFRVILLQPCGVSLPMAMHTLCSTLLCPGPLRPPLFSVVFDTHIGHALDALRLGGEAEVNTLFLDLSLPLARIGP